MASVQIVSQMYKYSQISRLSVGSRLISLANPLVSYASITFVLVEFYFSTYKATIKL